MTPRLLCPADIPDAMRLKEAAGWNQTERDWRNILALEPEGCFAIECDGRVVTTTTALCYGRDLAWVGMVLTAPEYRGQGFARRLMERALEFLEARGVAWIKLDATDMGRPLYLQFGFQDECAVERWHRPAAAPLPSIELPPGPVDFDLDRAAFGTAREAVLERIATETATVPGCGYAMGRPGSRAAYFGPAVARTADAARTLLRWFLARHAAEDVYWDLLPGNAAALEIAREFGFERRRSLVRMSRPGVPQPPPFTHDDGSVFAIGGFAYG